MGRAWLHVIGRSTDVRLVGLADLDLEAARRAAADAGFPDLRWPPPWRICSAGSRPTR